MISMNNREQKGITIANSNMIRKIDDHAYKVKSQSGNGEYEVISTDGAFNYKTAFYKEYRTRAVKDRPVHIRHIRFWGDNNNNKMERLNGEIRDREKTMRGIKKMNTPILKGYQVYHNFFRTHEGLDGKTPAQACGIEIQGDNKWKTFIENASRK